MFASRNSHRGVRFAAACALCVGVAALATVSACSAGNITQTAAQVPAVPGANATAGADGYLALRDLVVVYNNSKGYPVGSSAPLVVRIFNGSLSPVKLVRVTAGDAAQRVVLTGGPVLISMTSGVPTPSTSTPSAQGSATPTGKVRASASASLSPSNAPTPGQSASETQTTPPGKDNLSIEIAANSYALLVPGQGAYLQLIGLTAPLSPGMLVPLTFTFDDGTSVTVSVPFGLPSVPAPRASAAIHPTE